MENNSVKSLTDIIAGQTGYYHHDGLKYPVVFLDLRKVWGRVDVRISPLDGEGDKWVEIVKVSVK